MGIRSTRSCAKTWLWPCCPELNAPSAGEPQPCERREGWGLREGLTRRTCGFQPLMRRIIPGICLVNVPVLAGAFFKMIYSSCGLRDLLGWRGIDSAARHPRFGPKT
jgi:hypothetical protein